MQKNSFYNKYGFWVIFVVVFLLSFIWMGTSRTLKSNSNNVADWLPDSYIETQEYKWFIKHFPFESFIVASWKGCALDDGRLEMYAQKLVPGQTIDNMEEWAEFEDPTLSAELQIPEGNNTQHKNTDKKSNKESKADSGDSVEIAGGTVTVKSPVQENAPTDENDVGTHYFKSVITGERMIRMMQDRYPALTREQILSRLDGVLIGPETVSKDGKTKSRNTALIVTLTSVAKDKELRKVVEKMKDLARECGIEPILPPDNRSTVHKIIVAAGTTLYEMVNKRHPSTDGVILGGPPIDNVTIGLEGERTLFRLAGLCALTGFIIAYGCLRNFLYTMIVFWNAILSAGIALAFVAFSGGHCDAILLSMPALVYVLTMSASIHMLNYYFDAIRDDGLHGAPEAMIMRAWYPCVVSSISSAIGLGSLYSSHLIPIIKFGIYSAVGVLASLLLLFLYLPSLLHFFPDQKFAKKYSGRGPDAVQHDLFINFWRLLGGFIIRHHNAVAIACVIATVFFTFGCYKIKTSVKMMRFFSGDSEIIAHYTWLENHLGPLVPMEVVIEFDNEKNQLYSLEKMQFVSNICKELRTKLPDEIGGVMSAATFGPDLNIAGTPGSTSWKWGLYGTSGQIDRNRIKMKDFVSIEKIPFDPQQAKTPEKQEEVRKKLDQMGVSPETASKLVNAGIASIDQLLFAPDNWILPGYSQAETKQLRQNVQNWQNKHGKDLWRISMRVWALKGKDIDYAEFIDEVKKVVNPIVQKPTELLGTPQKKKILGDNAMSAVYTGMVPVVYKTQHELLNGLTDSFLSSAFSIAIVFMIVLKNPLAGGLAVFPNIFPTILVFGLLGQMGILVDVGMMMSASVALGMSVDDTIHYLTWFRDAVDRGMGAKEAAMDAYERCATAMTETTLVAGFGLSIFAFSTFTPTQMFGVMMLVVLMAALFGDLIFLPAVLTGPMGRFFLDNKRKKTQPAKVTDEVGEISIAVQEPGSESAKAESGQEAKETIPFPRLETRE